MFEAYIPDKRVPDRAWIQEYTRMTSPLLVPELMMYLATDASPLWRATDENLREWGVEDPFWAFAWPGGQALARFILDRPSLFAGRSVLDFGTGSGIAALAAAKSGAVSVRALDIDPWSKVAVELNAQLNGVDITCEISEISFSEWIPEDIVLFADMTYETPMAAEILKWIQLLNRANKTVWIADPGRGYLLEQSFAPVATYSAPSDIDTEGAYLIDTHIYRV